jgi:hypothetical protein
MITQVIMNIDMGLANRRPDFEAGTQALMDGFICYDEAVSLRYISGYVLE